MILSSVWTHAHWQQVHLADVSAQNEPLTQPADAPWTSWLQEPGSLTKRIGRQWGPVQVHPQRQGVDTPEPAEWAAVAQPAQAGPAWVREVELWSGGQARLAARTVVLHWSAHNPWARVQQLGHQPLGELLFTWPDIVRGPVYAAHTPLGWARYGIYHRHAAPLLLLEVFLPALVQS